jgi:hypothetical protein
LNKRIFFVGLLGNEILILKKHESGNAPAVTLVFFVKIALEEVVGVKPAPKSVALLIAVYYVIGCTVVSYKGSHIQHFSNQGNIEAHFYSYVFFKKRG